MLLLIPPWLVPQLGTVVVALFIPLVGLPLGSLSASTNFIFVSPALGLKTSRILVVSAFRFRKSAFNTSI